MAAGTVEHAGELASILLGRVDFYSLEVTAGSHSSALSLMHEFVPKYHDDGSPSIKLTDDVMDHFNPKERWAMTYARERSSLFNRNFGVGSTIGEVLDWGNPNLQDYFLHLARAVQGLLHPDGEFAESIVDSMVENNEAFRGLVVWAEKLLTEGEELELQKPPRPFWSF